jgi:hypothetical protein
MDINSQHHNLLGNQISPKSRIFVFWRPFLVENGHHSKPKIFTVVCGSFWGLKKFKMATVVTVTKVQKMLNSNRTADPFET